MKTCRKLTTGILASLVLLGPWTLSWASGGMFERPGVIGMRALVKDSEGNPEFVEYDQNGEVAGTIGHKRGELADARVMSANKYRVITLQYRKLKDESPEQTQGAQIFSKEDYLSQNFGTISVWDGDTQSYIDVPVPTLSDRELNDNTVSVLVRNNQTIPDPRFLPEDRANVLFEAPINLKEGILQTDLKDSVRSLLIGPEGEILKKSEHNIGFRTAYVESREDGEEPTLLGMAPDDNLLGPVVGARVFTSLDPTERWASFSDDEGRFSARYYIVPCPGFSFTYDFTIDSAVKYKSFNPQSGSPTAETYFRTFGTHTCIGYSEITHPLAPGLQATLAAIEASMAVPTYMAHIPVDAILFTGEGQLVNPGPEGGFQEIPVDSETRYRSDVAPVTEPTAPSHLDLDADRKEDWVSDPDEDGMVDVILGEEPAGFNDEGQPVDEDGNVIEPDLRRVADHEPDFESRGLLESISPDDLEDTDLYIYRESTGELVAEKRGLKEREVQQEEGRFVYRMFLPGPAAGFSIRSNFHDGLEAWQSEAGLTESLRGRDVDSLRPGESVKIIAINRPTGYIGTVNTTIEPSIEGGRLDFPIDKLKLAPPNLKVKAERVYIVASGLTSGERKKHTIGFEGSALTEDKYISIRTEWYDHDGRPLPNDLDGYTGRLAQVVGENTLAPATAGQSAGEGSGAGFFSITPGTHRQVIKLKNDVLSTEHFYVHVSGQPRSELADFSETGAGDGLLQYRPRHYTPVRVPIFDETATRRLRNQAFYREDDGAEIDDSDIQPMYHWPYRPEMQFSVLDLETERLAFQFDDSAGESRSLDLSDLSQNDFNELLSEVTALDLLYALTQSDDAPLELFNMPGQLVFAFGEDEVAADVGEDGSVEFSNLEHLSDLSLEDFLTIRLFRNNDAENVLWEWAFLPNIYFVDETGQKIPRDRSFSHPNPVIEIGKGPDLVPIGTDDITVDSATGNASVDITGRIFSDIADVADDPSGEINDVYLYVTNQTTEGAIKKIRVPVTNASEFTTKDYLPFDPDSNVDSLDDEHHPFIGEFNTTLNFVVSEGDVTILAEAVNAIGNDGHDAIELQVDNGENGTFLSNVQNRENSDRGLFQPLWMQVEDPLLDKDELSEGSIRLLGNDRELIEHSGKIYAEGALIRVARSIDGVESANIANILTEQEPVTARYESPADEIDTPPSETKMSWSYTAASPPNYYKYAAGTTVGQNWVAPIWFQNGWEVTDAQIMEKTGWFWASSEKPDNDIEFVTHLPLERNGKQEGVKLVLDLNKDSHLNPEKRIKITLEKEDKTASFITNVYFKSVPLKTILLAVDGFAYESARQVVSDASNFNEIFGDSSGTITPALSALPTITWANWPGVFGGGPPRTHGIIGNSYFPREHVPENFHPLALGDRALAFPVASAGQSGGLSIDKLQQLGVALGGNHARGLSAHGQPMRTRALDSAGSLYDDLAGALGKSPDNPLSVRSIRVFYDKSSDSVDMDATYFSRLDPFTFSPVAPTGHDAESARILDNGLERIIIGPPPLPIVLSTTIGTGPQARMAWQRSDDSDEVFSLYFPGPDNVGHGLGDEDGVDAIGEVTEPVSQIYDHASAHTDAAIGALLAEIKEDGYSNTVLFAATGDHGLHQFSEDQERVITNADIEELVETPQANGGLGQVLWRGSDTTDEGSNNFSMIEYFLNSKSNVVYSAIGGMAQFYLRSPGRTWQSPPANNDIKRLASLLYREAKGHKGYNSTQILNDLKAKESDLEKGGAFGNPPAIFVKVGEGNNFEEDFQWVKNIEKNPDATNDPSDYIDWTLGSIDEFLVAKERAIEGWSKNNWPAFKLRMDEMNHQHPTGSRTGDIVVVMNGKSGYLAVNESHDSYPGWHGGPTVSESRVPIMFGMPGSSFVDRDGGRVNAPPELDQGVEAAFNLCKDSQDTVRNWHLSVYLQTILTRMYSLDGPDSCLPSN